MIGRPWAVTLVAGDRVLDFGHNGVPAGKRRAGMEVWGQLCACRLAGGDVYAHGL
jgi:hypothetical protein